MLSELGKLTTRLRQRFSRTHLLSRWLGYDVPDADTASGTPERGLIILQVDGLSRRQFETALARNRLPFLRRMIRRGYFQQMSFYSGLPSATPAVQAEVMYGVKCAVPAFQFLHRKSGRVFRMYDQEAVETVVQERLEKAEPLLESGASYANIYSGGAAEARCCFETTDLPDALKELSPLRLVTMFFLYFFTLVRITLLTGVELVVGLTDMIRGLFTSRDWPNEIRFVPGRVLVSIVLREWVGVTVKLAVERGTPVIFANLLGYDEQAHRRGPGAAFAHWGLKGIDKTIQDIFQTARRSENRDYEVIVYSDHGQEESRIYEFESGQTIQEAVEKSLTDSPLGHHLIRRFDLSKHDDYLDQRMRRLMKIRRGRSDVGSISRDELADSVVVTALGPLGHVYFPVPVTDNDRSECAQQLVNREQVPLVIYRLSNGQVFARNARGLWQLPEDVAQICGPHQHFAHEIQQDLVRLSEHPDAGDVIICGWSPETDPVTFTQEHGAHGGIGVQETRGFALIPRAVRIDTRTTPEGETYIRGVDLHHAGMEFRERRHSDNTGAEEPTVSTTSRNVPATNGRPEASRVAATPAHRESVSGGSTETRLRVMTYNAHRCVGLDGKCRPRRIADVIADADADLIALQEIDVHRSRTGHLDQTAEIAAQLGMYHRFFPVWSGDDGQYGLAILSRYPFSPVREHILTEADLAKGREARGAMWGSIETESGPVHFLNTHLGLRTRERQRQSDELLSARWMNDLQTKEPVILAGDLNAGPKSAVMRKLTRHLRCVQLVAEDHRPQRTFASMLPLRRIDHILVSRHFHVSTVAVPRTHVSTRASDHLPVCAEVVLVPELRTLNQPARSFIDTVGAGDFEKMAASGGIP
ncbi:MAG: endonuclease/exonuclease/phosphatase family protein [Fuerstiella sp.]